MSILQVCLLRGSKMNNSSIMYHPDSPEFRECIDNIVRMAEHDSELAAGLQVIDRRARDQSCSIYEAVFLVMQRHQAEMKAKAWLANR